MADNDADDVTPEEASPKAPDSEGPADETPAAETRWGEKDEPGPAGEAGGGEPASAGTADRDPADRGSGEGSAAEGATGDGSGDDGAGDDGAGEKAPPVPPEPVRRRGRRVLRWVAVGVVLALVAAGGTAFGLYEKLQGNITKEHVDQRQLGTNRPPKLNKSMNILLLGSDSRDGENHEYWSPDIAGERSDTTILLHLSPNRDRAVAISFPRDSMVHVPECRKKKGGTVPAFFGMLNAAFAYAGATCTWKMIEADTDIHIDHYVKIDFAGFKKVVDALGGVEICVPQAVNDPRANLSLKAGRQVVKGNDALGYVRTRYGLGDGSDLERIQRQQKFMASVVKKATSQAMLTDPTRTYRFLNAVTKAISTDDDFSVSAMRKLATSLKGMSAGTVRFVTVPTQTYPKDPNRVQWDMAQAGPLFDAIRKDDDLPAPKPEPSMPVAPKPDEVKVTAVNAPKKAVQDLKGQGFHVKAAKGPAQPQTRILYGPGAERFADALAVAVPGVVIAADNTVAPGTVSLVVGPEGVQVKAPDIPKVNGEINGAQNPCQ
ncbi:LCP family protein [Actinoallomurus soli]|uniref:LCP family protein n=1 Tax=Actinoallomurus soli TaxID=2952535 RepID=UPI002093362D|nr:LCP family protein [Actinoallomurus soli]MCO5973493.1 LCP family protein [Actinoallomurus soli]